MELNIQEALRYLGVHEPDAALLTSLSALADELQQRISPRFAWVLAETADLRLPGNTAAKMLADCPRCAVLVCTLGATFDAWVRREQARDLTRAVMLDALGSVWVEAGCDAAEEAIHARFPEAYLTDRFSPGYGDLPLDVQPMLLDRAGGSRLGVTLTDSMLMVPQKSVTAIVGIASTPQSARIRGCAYCTLRNTCPYRKAGTTCHV